MATRTPTMAARKTNHGIRGLHDCKTSAILLSTFFYSPSSLVRTLFGPRSELLRNTPEQGPNEVRTKEYGEWNKTGTRVKQDYIKSIQDNKNTSFRNCSTACSKMTT
ncbi:hypothetical protein [Sphingobacterium sp. 1.A.5]|uniref:hypothetical protein n=1 Tax=Sphingobacterium sp. 1.A.5 TaxID=2044604 RepID=UPI001181AFE8|nr:hypothetical protein [Sphingobacterium sp. 1.A.5]